MDILLRQLRYGHIVETTMDILLRQLMDILLRQLWTYCRDNYGLADIEISGPWVTKLCI